MYYRIVFDIREEYSQLNLFCITDGKTQIPILAASEGETDDGPIVSVVSYEKDPNPGIFIEAELDELVTSLSDMLKESSSIDLNELKILTEGLDLDIPEEGIEE